MNSLDKKEIDEGWILMFDGNTTEGWRTYLGTAPPRGWVCDDQCLKCLGLGRDDGGDIIFERARFMDFHLKLEWKVSGSGNSGIFYMAEELPGEPIWKSGFEMQILDNHGHPDAQLGKNKNRQAGSLYDLVPALPQNANPAGYWNSVEIISDHGKVVHFMNGNKILEFDINDITFRNIVSESKFSNLAEFGKYRSGFIALQDHGSVVWFRNIKIKPL